MFSDSFSVTLMFSFGSICSRKAHSIEPVFNVLLVGCNISIAGDAISHKDRCSKDLFSRPPRPTLSTADPFSLDYHLISWASFPYTNTTVYTTPALTHVFVIDLSSFTAVIKFGLLYYRYFTPYISADSFRESDGSPAFFSNSVTNPPIYHMHDGHHERTARSGASSTDEQCHTYTPTVLLLIHTHAQLRLLLHTNPSRRSPYRKPTHLQSPQSYHVCICRTSSAYLLTNSDT